MLEDRPYLAGDKAGKVYANSTIPTRIVLEPAVGYMMERENLVVVVSEGVVENMGIFNKMGTCTMRIDSAP